MRIGRSRSRSVHIIQPCASVLFGLEREVAAQVRCNALEVIGDGTGALRRNWDQVLCLGDRHTQTLDISEFANIKYMAKIGQTVQANDPILAFDDTEDEFSSQLLSMMIPSPTLTPPTFPRESGTDISEFFTMGLESRTSRYLPSLTKVLVEEKRRMKEQYGQKVKEMLKKKK